MRLFTAVSVFFRILLNKEFAQQIKELTEGQSSSDAPAAKPVPAPAASKPKRAERSEAITLLAALQREARLIDFLQEPLDGYSDAQIGAAARDVHRQSRDVLQRMFAIEPILAEQEGSAVEVPSGYDTGVYRVTGNVSGDPPFRGTMVHHGWKAATCQVPQWSGGKDATHVVAPIEVELK